MRTITDEGRSPQKRFMSWVLNVVGTGIGAAIGIAIVGFVTYTVVGVYELKELNRDIYSRLTESEKAIGEIESRSERRLNQMREEIIKSNQVAIKLLVEEISLENKREKNQESAPMGLGTIKDFQIAEPQVLKADALQHRFREAQQQIQQNW